MQDINFFSSLSGLGSTRAHGTPEPKDANGDINKDKLEDAFSKYVEDPGIRAIDSIPHKANQGFSLTGENKGALAFFVAMLATRGPGFRDSVEEFHKKIVEKVDSQIIHESIVEGDCPDVINSLISIY